MFVIYIICCDYLTIGVCYGMASDLARSVAHHTHTYVIWVGRATMHARDGSYVVHISKYKRMNPAGTARSRRFCDMWRYGDVASVLCPPESRTSVN